MGYRSDQYNRFEGESMSSSQVYSRVVEWSPSGVTGYDASVRRLAVAENLSALAANWGGGPILVTISRRSTFVKAVRVPNAGASEVNLILQTQMASMFPVPLHELSYSFRLTDDINADGRLAVVAAMRESELKGILAEARDAGFKVEKVIPAALGSVLLIESLGVKDAAVVQSTHEGLAIDLLEGGELKYSRVAPLPDSPGAAEAEVARSFAAVGIPASRVIAAGGIEYPSASSVSPMPSIEALATMPVDKLGINIETREAVERREKAAQSKRSRLAALLCAAAVLMAVLVFVERSDKAGERQASQAKWNGRLTKLRSERKKQETKLNGVIQLADSIKRAFEPAQKASDVMTLIANQSPKGLWLTGITFERGKTTFVRGTSKDSAGVSDYLQALTTEERLRDVKLVFANNGDIDKTPVVQFSIQGFAVGNLPLVDAKKKKGSR